MACDFQPATMPTYHFKSSNPQPRPHPPKKPKKQQRKTKTVFNSKHDKTVMFRNPVKS